MASRFFFAIRKKEAFHAIIDWKQILSILRDYLIGIIYLTFLFQIVSRLFPGFYDENAALFLFVNVFASLLVFSFPALRQLWVIIPLAVADLVLTVLQGIHLRASQLWIYVAVLALFVIRNFISDYNYQRIPVNALRPRMILSAANVAIMLPSGIKNLPVSVTEDLRGRLTKAEVAAVNHWYTLNPTYETVTIVSKIPFGIFIALGSGALSFWGGCNDRNHQEL